MALDEIDQRDAAARFGDLLGADHGVDRPVGALHQHIRLQAHDQVERRVAVEAGDRVDRCQCGDDRGAVGKGVDRTFRPLEPARAGIAVERDEEPVALRARRRQERDMAGMQDIEAAIGEADREAAALPLTHQRLGLAEIVEPAVGRGLLVAPEFEHQFVELDGRGAELGNDDAGGGVGEPHRLGQRAAAGVERAPGPRSPCRRRPRRRTPRAPAPARC